MLARTHTTLYESGNPWLSPSWRECLSSWNHLRLTFMASKVNPTAATSLHNLHYNKKLFLYMKPLPLNIRQVNKVFVDIFCFIEIQKIGCVLVNWLYEAEDQQKGNAPSVQNIQKGYSPTGSQPLKFQSKISFSSVLLAYCFDKALRWGIFHFQKIVNFQLHASYWSPSFQNFPRISKLTDQETHCLLFTFEAVNRNYC